MKRNGEPATDEISAKLKQAIRLLAMVLIDGKKQRDQISLLSKAGLDRHEIAEILGTTAGTVSVELSVLKRHSGRKEKRT